MAYGDDKHKKHNFNRNTFITSNIGNLQQIFKYKPKLTLNIIQQNIILGKLL